MQSVSKRYSANRLPEQNLQETTVIWLIEWPDVAGGGDFCRDRAVHSLQLGNEPARLVSRGSWEVQAERAFKDLTALDLLPGLDEGHP